MSTEIAEAPATLPAKVDPLALIQSAIEKGLDPAQLEKLFDLQERWEKNRAIEAYNAAMNRCQTLMPKVIKDAVNQHTKSRYARLEAVNRVAKPIYSAEGISISFGEQTSLIPEHVRLVADVLHVAGHSQQYYLDLPLDGTGVKGNANMTPIQGKLSSFSYGQRRLICNIFNITVADEDIDGNPQPNGPAYITPEQAAEIDRLLVATGSDHEKFLAWLDTPSITGMPATLLPKAMDSLNRKEIKPNVLHWIEQLPALTTATAFAAIMPDFYKLTEADERKIVWNLLLRRAKQIGCIWNKEEKLWEPGGAA